PFFLLRPPPPPALYPLSHTTLFRSRLQSRLELAVREEVRGGPLRGELVQGAARALGDGTDGGVVQVDGVRRPGKLRGAQRAELIDRKSTRLNSSHVSISYAVFCLKK